MCTESLSSLEQEWFCMSALNNRVMPALNKSLSYGNPSDTWARMMFSKVVLEMKVWSCRDLGEVLQTVVIFKTVFFWVTNLLTFCCSLVGGWTSGSRSAGSAMLSSHLSLLVFTQKGASPVRSCIFHIPAPQPVLIRQPALRSFPRPELAKINTKEGKDS